MSLYHDPLKTMVYLRRFWLALRIMHWPWTRWRAGYDPYDPFDNIRPWTAWLAAGCIHHGRELPEGLR